MAHFVCLRYSACDPDLWPFDLEAGAKYSRCHGVPSCQFWWYYDYSFSIYGPFGQHGSD